MAHIGLLEDNARIARLSATMLQFIGHTVTLYEQGRTLLDALQDSRCTSSAFERSLIPSLPIDVLILDLQLPDMPGIEVVQHLQAYPYTCTLPIIFCTAASRHEIAQVLRVAPNARTLEKPFRLQALTDAVRDALNLQRVHGM